MLSSIYLTGGSNEPYPNPYSEISAPYADWRSLALNRLQGHGLKVVNPLEFAWSDFSLNDQAIETIDYRNEY